jgi:hypothetical protein
MASFAHISRADESPPTFLLVHRIVHLSRRCAYQNDDNFYLQVTTSHTRACDGLATNPKLHICNVFLRHLSLWFVVSFDPSALFVINPPPKLSSHHVATQSLVIQAHNSNQVATSTDSATL